VHSHRSSSAERHRRRRKLGPAAGTEAEDWVGGDTAAEGWVLCYTAAVDWARGCIEAVGLERGGTAVAGWEHAEVAAALGRWRTVHSGSFACVYGDC
jgi:hypothetical protein